MGDRMKLERIKQYLKHKIDNSWYFNAKIDYNIDGHFIDCELLDKNTLKITWEEMGKKEEKIINYYWDYSLEQLYNIWMEG